MNFKKIDESPKAFILVFQTGDKLAARLLQFAKEQKLLLPEPEFPIWMAPEARVSGPGDTTLKCARTSPTSVSGS